jgi:hypothetical protein
MADWYVSSAAYGGIAAFVPSVAYSVGQIVKPTAPALKAQWALRCTVAGTASTEPAWPTTNNGTVVSGGATFANVSGQSAYGWGAAAGDIPTLIGAVGTTRFAAGDRMFVSSDHAETQAASTTYGSGSGTASYTSAQVLSVNRAGSVPPVAADLTPGATATVTTGTLTIDATFPVYHYGMNYVFTSSATSAIVFNATGVKTTLLDGCQLYLNTASTTPKIGSGNASTCILHNSTLRFGNASQGIQPSTGGAIFEFIWLNTPSAIAGATIPSLLFIPTGANTNMTATLRGVDLSAITGTLVGNANAGGKYLFDSCRIASGVTRYSTTTVANTRDLVELINCYDGTSILAEKYTPAGTVTTERTITLAGGATDDVGIFSHKMVSGTNIDKFVQPLDGFWMDVEYQTTGSSKTATVEIISSASLTNDEISLFLEYQGSSGSPVASFVSTGPGSVLGTPSALATSTATWNSSPATPVKQLLSVTFTPLLAGRVRGQVRLGKASTTAYVNPVITIA